MKELRLAIIGCFGRGRVADNAHDPEHGVRIVAGADKYPDALEVFKARYREKFDFEPTCYLDYREMIEKEKPDGVFITSPDFLHEEHAVFCLEHKVAVYLEKPIAITIAGADRILEAAYRNRTPLMLGHNMRYMSHIMKMKELVDAGAVGEVKSIWCRHFVSYGGDAYFRDWHAREKYCNSLLLQKGAHDIDVIHWLAGGYTERVHGMGNLSVYDKLPRRGEDNLRFIGRKTAVWDTDHYPATKQKDFYPWIEVNDLNMINMQLDNGVLACYLQCHYTPDGWRNYTVIGTEGRLENFGMWRLHLWNHRTDTYTEVPDVVYNLPQPKTGTHGGADPKIIRSFVDALRGVYDVHSSPQAARNSVAAGCQGADSIRQNGIPLDVPPLPEHLRNYDFIRCK
ncbi:MAG: Gfo/Idh/MocA family oxidoreductase [Lentisphaeria bacterium]|nr:Gfo/Idh/MocA family oxidoreductase [Lentisphaeria bacterium]